MYLANHLDSFQESVIREMTRKAIENGAINLSQGMPDFLPPKELISGVEDALMEEEHQYSITYGRTDLREKIAGKLKQYNKMDFNPNDEITITCGASEALASSIFALMNPGEEIIVLEPWYENYVPITYLAQGKPIFVPLAENTFDIDEEKLKDSINSKTKAIVINSPHNPTGKVFSLDDLKIIADLCVDNNIIAITDEIYEYIIFDTLSHKSLGSIDSIREQTITVSGFSKTFSITGWRLGYVAANRELMEGIRKCHDYLTVCAPSLLQYATLKAFTLGNKYYEDIRNRYKVNRDYLMENLHNHGFKIFKPNGAYYLFADITEFGMNDLEFSNFLVRDKGVAVVPGSSFYSKERHNHGSRFVRFTFSQKLATLKEAIERIEKKL